MSKEKKDGVSIALYPRTLKALDDCAAEEGRTRSGMAERILSRYFQERDEELKQDEGTFRRPMAR